MKEKKFFYTACICSILLLLTMCYFGTNFSIKGTSAINANGLLNISCPSNLKMLDHSASEKKVCCPNQSDSVELINNKYYCKNKTYLDDADSGISLTLYNSQVYCTVALDWGASREAMCSNKLGSDWSVLNKSDCIYSPVHLWMCTCKANLSACATEAVMPSGNFTGGSVKIIGTNKIGETLQAIITDSNPKASEYVYQWYYSWDSDYSNGGGVISGATSSKLTLSESKYIGKYIYIEVLAKKDNYNMILFDDITDVSNNGSAKVLESEEEKEITITLDGNGGTFSSTTTSNAYSNTKDVNVIIGEPYGSLYVPVNVGYKLYSWNTKKNGSGDKITSSTNVSINDGDIIYAQWQAESVKVKYMRNYNSNDEKFTEAEYSYRNENVQKFSSLSRSGFSLIGWDSDSDGDVDFTAGQTVDDYWIHNNSDETIILKAIWEKEPSNPSSPSGEPEEKTYNVTFDANGGNVDKNSDSCKSTTGSCEISDLPTATWDNYTFKGWGTSKNCTSGNTSSITLTETSNTYYACWIEKEIITDTNPEEPDEEIKEDTKPSEDSNGNVNDGPLTGENTLIAIIWFFGLLAIGYAYYYFKEVKNH